MSGPIGNLHAARWIPEHDNFLRARLTEGMSTSQAAVALNREFGTSYSRNACIGRASRKNMARDHTHGPKQRKAKAEPAEKPRRRTKAPAMATTKPERGRAFRQPPAAEVLPGELRCVEIEPRHVSLTDLQPGDCRWPYGDGPFTFCGHPAVFGSYCGPHYGLSRSVGTRSEQAATRLSRKVA